MKKVDNIRTLLYKYIYIHLIKIIFERINIQRKERILYLTAPLNIIIVQNMILKEIKNESFYFNTTSDN